MMKTYAVIVAGGNGERMGTSVPKQFLPLRNKPILQYSAEAFLNAFPGINIILVVPSGHMTRGHELAAVSEYPGQVSVIEGGENRFQSVKNGLKHIERDSIVFVHDGVRCLITPALIMRCYEHTLKYGNAIPAITATDSIRIVNGDSNIAADRTKIFMVQTPQTFQSAILLDAFSQEYQPGFTDEASVVEKNGIQIHLVEGEISNIKITRPIDLILAEGILGLGIRG